jgi:transposase-like protein
VPASTPIERMSLFEFQERFADEAACLAFMVQTRWPQGFVCPRCACAKGYWIATRRAFECSACGHQASVTANTVMHRSKLPLRTWFWAIYLCATDKRGLSAKALQSRVGISYPTAWFVLHRIRSAMAQRDSRYMLSGGVEMDESFVGGQSKCTPGTGDRAGGGTDKARVIVAMSLHKGRPAYLRMQAVRGPVHAADVLAFTQASVSLDSHITTDGASLYTTLDKNHFGHTAKPFYKEGPEFLKWLHVIASNLKAFVQGTYHGLGQVHLQAYLDEFCYRFSRRWEPRGLFSRLLTACAAGDWLPWTSLVAQPQVGP